MIGDTFRRAVARTVAQQLAPNFEEACAPHQYALSTRAGTECVARLLRAATELNPRLTVTSIDGIGAHDFMIRRGMVQGLHRSPALEAALPFVRLFYSDTSTYLWYDDEGTCHEVCQAEGGEQGDPLMPALYALGQHEALARAAAGLRLRAR